MQVSGITQTDPSAVALLRHRPFGKQRRGEGMVDSPDAPECRPFAPVAKQWGAGGSREGGGGL